MSDWITFPDGTRGRLSWDGEARMAARWQALLQACHGQDMRPHCDCRWQGEPVPLVVRRRVRQQDGRPVEAFHLARFPGQGDWHAPGCPFHDPDPARSGRGGYEAGVIEEQADGRLRVSLDQSLRIMPRAQGEVTPRAGREAGAAGQGGGGQSQMSSLGLVHLLWERAGLNSWSPAVGRRRLWWTGVRQALEGAASVILPARGVCLADRLAMVGYGDEDGPALLRETARGCGQDWRIMLLGVVDGIDLRQGAGGRFTAVRFDGAQAYDLRVTGDAALHERLTRRFPMAMRALGLARAQRRIRVVGLAIASVRVGRDGERVTVGCRVADMVLMEVTPETLIPVASSHELAVATRLVAQGRSFIKPLRFDATRDVVHPDFVLTDTGDARGTPMEVFGRDDEAYAARRAQKCAYYTAVYGQEHWWSWNAVAQPDLIPDFPASVGGPPHG